MVCFGASCYHVVIQCCAAYNTRELAKSFQCNYLCRKRLKQMLTFPQGTLYSLILHNHNMLRDSIPNRWYLLCSGLSSCVLSKDPTDYNMALMKYFLLLCLCLSLAIVAVIGNRVQTSPSGGTSAFIQDCATSPPAGRFEICSNEIKSSVVPNWGSAAP